jgi:hypothetical protein
MRSFSHAQTKKSSRADASVEHVSYGHWPCHRRTGRYSPSSSHLSKTRGQREFRACWPLFLGVSLLIPGVLVPGVLVPGVRVLGAASQGVASQGVASPGLLLVLVVASSGPGGFRLTRLL